MPSEGNLPTAQETQVTDEKKRPEEVTDEQLEDVSGGVTPITGAAKNAGGAGAIPDVMQTPGGGSGIPTPYPNISGASTDPNKKTKMTGGSTGTDSGASSGGETG